MIVSPFDPGYLFLYGTLMRGFDLRRRVAIDAWVELVGIGSTRGALFDLGPYPGAIKAEGRLAGELYRVIDPFRLWPVVDEVEGYARDAPWRSEYVREVAIVTDAEARRTPAWVYFYAGLMTQAVWVPAGDYRAHVRWSGGTLL